MRTLGVDFLKMQPMDCLRLVNSCLGNLFLTFSCLLNQLVRLGELRGYNIFHASTKDFFQVLKGGFPSLLVIMNRLPNFLLLQI